jgi:hypothetical protein
MSNPIGDPGHGHSPAAWTAVIIMLVAISIGTVAFFLDMPWLVESSAVLVVVGLIAGFIVSKAGYGVHGPKYTAKEH